MSSIALKAKVGIAACAIAASASLIPIATAQAAPIQAPASPVLSGPAVPQFWGGWFGSHDLMKSKPHFFSFFKFFQWGCYGHNKGW
ncbi:hypothetical protein DVS77_15090 [Mycolicibacterium moriokaense]|nr:hypothetical protein DVS77_15090 [Mycolicibacterium moriokaense]